MPSSGEGHLVVFDAAVPKLSGNVELTTTDLASSLIGTLNGSFVDPGSSRVR